MTTVTSLTADRMLAIEAASVVDGDVDASGNLILTKHDGSQINAGSVIGPPGPQGPVGSDLVVLSAIPVLDVGTINQIRAGRQLTAADFTNMGLSAPLGLWNLSNLNDVSGNGRNLNNKGAVPFAVGINGGVNTAAQFSGNAGQALYIPDTGANDPFRLRTGSWGCWFRTAKRATFGMLVDKYGTNGQQGYSLFINNTNQLNVGGSQDGTANSIALSGISDVADDRWHFGVGTFDGTVIRIYVDGIHEASVPMPFPSLFPGASALNIGNRGADASTNGQFQHWGRVDEAFITADVLNEEQIRNLYCAKIPHTLAAVPSRSSINVRRRRRGATLVAADFSTQPLRLYNFSGGSLGDEGSNGAALTNPGNAVSVAGSDGSTGNAYGFNGAQSLPSTDAGLPSALNTRSYGCWFKSSSTAGSTIVGWGGTALGVADIRLGITNGSVFFTNGSDTVTGSFVADGLWHFLVVVEDNNAVDAVKRKLYVDGRLSTVSAVMNAITLMGANGLRIGTSTWGAQVFTGHTDAVFICNYALPVEDIIKLYNKSSQALTPSPKNAGDHIEAMDAANLFATFDALEAQHQIDLRVAA